MDTAPKRRWRLLAGAVGLLLAVGLAPWLSLGGVQRQVVRALQTGLGRSVAVDSVHPVLLPWPGVEFDGLRIGENPAFGAEDAIVAASARATLRLNSLWTGRLAFSRLHLEGASINLVRNRDGNWSVAEWLAGGAGTGATARPAPASAAVRFPYLDWSDARVNFKLDQSKTRFFLDDVEGSLARESGQWRLQARFQPTRSDLTLSDAGVVQLDGRWTAAPAPFHFDLALRLENSYLAGSSALLLGHDRGLHGVLNAAAHLHGDRRQFALAVTVQGQSLRRWDLLPLPGRITGAFSGTYDAAADVLRIENAGDPGFHFIQAQGEVRGLFGRPSAHMQVQVAKLPAADLLPLLQAFKRNLPADLRLQGVTGGAATLDWEGGAQLRGSATAAWMGFGMSAAGDRLLLPAATIGWRAAVRNGRTVQTLHMPAVEATLTAGNAPPRTVQVGADGDATRFSLSLTADGLSRAAAQAGCRLLGLPAFWPDAVQGSAAVKLRLGAAWPQFRQVGWSGTEVWSDASFAPVGGPEVALPHVRETLDDPKSRHVEFTATLGANPLQGWVDLPPAGAPVIFGLTAHSLAAAAVWEAIHPAPGLVTRMLGTAAPAWLSGFRGQGTVRVGDLDWQGIHAGLDMRLAAASAWQASGLRLQLGNGVFTGSAQLRGDRYSLQGSASNLDAAALLQGSRWRDRVSGKLAGTLQLLRTPGGDWPDMDASGQLVLTGGTVTGGAPDAPAAPAAFDRFSADFQVHGGVAQLQHAVWSAPGARYEGVGTVHPGRDFDLRLSGDRGALHLTGAPAPAASQGYPPGLQEALDRIQGNAASPGPYRDVVLRAADVNAWLAGAGAARLPQGVRSLSFSAHNGVLTGTARVDFDRLRGGAPVNPLLALFSGTHTVIADARLVAPGAPAARLEVTRAQLDGQELPNALIDLALRAFVQPRHPEIGRAFSVPLPAHAVRVELGDDQVRIVYPPAAAAAGYQRKSSSGTKKRY